MEIFLLYTILKLDALNIAITIFLVISALLVLFIPVVYYASDTHKVKNPAWKLWYNLPFGDRNKLDTPPEDLIVHIYKHLPYRVLFGIMLASLLLTITIPNTKEAAVLIAAHYTIEAASSEEGQKLVKLLRRKANEYLDEQLNGIKK